MNASNLKQGTVYKTTNGAEVEFLFVDWHGYVWTKVIASPHRDIFPNSLFWFWSDGGSDRLGQIIDHNAPVEAPEFIWSHTNSLLLYASGQTKAELDIYFKDMNSRQFSRYALCPVGKKLVDADAVVMSEEEAYDVFAVLAECVFDPEKNAPHIYLVMQNLRGPK